MRIRRLTWSAIGVFALALAGALPARAQTNHLWPRFSFTAGSYWIEVDDTIRIDATSERTGSDVELETDLGLPDNDSLLTFGFDWGFARKHSLGVRYYAYEREGSRSIDRVVTIGDETFPVGARLDASFETNSIEAIYDYWFVRKDNVGFAGSLGLVYLGVEASATGTAVFGPSGQTETREVSASTDLPVPMIGLALKGSPWHWLVLRADARYLPSVQIGDIDGEAASYSLGADFYLFGGFALGARYAGHIYEVDVDQSRWQGSVDLSSEGWQGYLRLSL
jgi:hypothetical protein